MILMCHANFILLRLRKKRLNLTAMHTQGKAHYKNAIQ